MRGHPIADEQIAYVRENFKNKTNYELAKDIGCSRSAINRMQKRYGLTKSEEHRHNMGVRAGKASFVATGGNIPNANTPEVIARRSKSYKARRDEEEIRYRWGLPQLTKIRVRVEPRNKRQQRENLIARGYIVDEANLIAYYTPGTNRSRRLENRKPSSTYKTYYHFRPYAGEELDR